MATVFDSSRGSYDEVTMNEFEKFMIYSIAIDLMAQNFNDAYRISNLNLA